MSDSYFEDYIVYALIASHLTTSVRVATHPLMEESLTSLALPFFFNRKLGPWLGFDIQ